MIYDLTEKLKFDEDPKLVIKDVELTVNSDAEAVLKLLDIMQTRGELAGAMDAEKLIFSEKDRKKLAGLRLKIDDYLEVLKAAVQLALGNDPGEEPPAGE